MHTFPVNLYFLLKQTLEMEILNKAELVTPRVELLAKHNSVEFDEKINSVLSSANIRY